jgi:hypothetical protein
VPVIESSLVANNKEPLFVLSLRFHEIFCLIDNKDPELIIEGDQYRKVLNEIILYVMLHPQPELEVTGHPWAIVKIVEKNRVKLLL